MISSRDALWHLNPIQMHISGHIWVFSLPIQGREPCAAGGIDCLPKTWVLGWGVAQLVEGLPSKCKALVFSIPSTEREREREKEGRREGEGEEIYVYLGTPGSVKG
jgi:hypothetical protein